MTLDLRPGDITPLIGPLRARGAVSALNYPEGGEVSGALQAAGAEVTLRQYEMAVALA